MKHLLLLFFCSLIFLAFLSISACQKNQQNDPNFYRVEDFQSIEKIDVHVHINTVKPDLIDQGVKENIKMVSINVETGGMPVSEQQRVAIELGESYSDRIAYITTFSIEGFQDSQSWTKNSLTYLKDSFESGALGVKVWKNVGMELRDEDGTFVMIDDKRFDPLLQYLSDHHIPLFGHIGEPKNCWLPLEEMTVANDRNYFENHPQYHMYLHPDYPTYEEIITARNNMLDKFPDLTFFGLHLGSMEWSIEMMSDHLDTYPNMVLGMAHRIPHLQYLAQHNRESLRDFFIKYQDRFIYSTDLSYGPLSNPEEVRKLASDTWRSDWEFFITDNTLEVWQVEGSFQGLKLPKEVVDKLYRENARKWIPGLKL